MVCGLRRVADVNSFQSDTGERLASVKLEWFGGATTIMVELNESEKFRSYVGQIVSAPGALEFDPAKKRAKFHLTNVERR